MKIKKIKKEFKLGRVFKELLKREDELVLKEQKSNIEFCDRQIDGCIINYISKYGVDNYRMKCKDNNILPIINKNILSKKYDNNMILDNKINIFFLFNLREDDDFESLIESLNNIIELRQKYLDNYNFSIKKIRNNYPRLVLRNIKDGILEKNYMGDNLLRVKGIYKHQDKFKLLIKREQKFYVGCDEVYSKSNTYYQETDLDKIIHEDDIENFKQNKEWIGKWLDKYNEWVENCDFN